MLDATITITRSSHPEFKYFVSTTVEGRQFATRTQTSQAAWEWVESLIEQGAKYEITFTVDDQTGEYHHG